MNADPQNLSNVFNAGETYALAGDNLPTSESCLYYRKAAEVFEKLDPKLQGDHATIQGKSFRLAPFRLHTAEELARVKRQLATCNDRVPTHEPTRNPAVVKAVTQMTEYARQGDFDKAIRTGLAVQQESPVVYQQIAMVYLMRCGKEPKLRDQWAHEARLYAKRALEVDASRRDFLDFYQVGWIFETAGDLSSSERCDEYEEASKAFAAEVPLLKGDYIASYGYRHALAPIREENEKSSARVRAKLVGAGCH
jgi:hypothetical protein